MILPQCWKVKVRGIGLWAFFDHKIAENQQLEALNDYFTWKPYHYFSPKVARCFNPKVSSFSISNCVLLLPKDVIPEYIVQLMAIEIEGGSVFCRWVVAVYSLVKRQRTLGLSRWSLPSSLQPLSQQDWPLPYPPSPKSKYHRITKISLYPNQIVH